MTLKGVRGVEKPNWEPIIDNSSNYKLLYALHVIEYLMEEDEQGHRENDASQSQNNAIEIQELLSSNKDSEIREFKKNWRADFIVYGGFDHLFKVFMQTAKKETLLTNIFDKNILSFILKILRNYLAATFAYKVPNIYRSLAFIRLFHLSLDFMSEYIQSDNTKSVNLLQLNKDFQNNTTDEITVNKQNTDDSSSLDKKQASTCTNNLKEKEEKKKERLKMEESNEFITLAEKLKGELGDHIISTINFKDMIKLITSLGNDILSKNGELESEDRLIVEYSLSILTAILLFEKENITYFLNPNDKPEFLANTSNFIIDGIFCSKSLNIRKYFSHSLFILSKEASQYQSSFVSKFFIVGRN